MKITSWKNLLVMIAAALLFVNLAFAKDNEVETRGFITELSSTAVTVNGVTYALTPDTEYKNEDETPLTFSDFNVDDLVKVEGPRVNGQLVAEELEKEDDVGGGGAESSSRIIVRGVITSISETKIVVGDSVFALVEQTDYEGEDDQPLTREDFEAGDVTKVKGYRKADGSLVALEVEQEDELKSGGTDNEGEGKGSGEEIKLHCTLPNLNAIRGGLERSIEQALSEADARAKVKVKTRILSKDDSQNVAPPEATQGINVLVNTTGDGALLSFSGEAGIPTCNAVLQIQVRVRGFNPITGVRIEEVITEEIPIVGVYAQKDRRRRRR